MKNRKESHEAIPDEFAGYEEAAEFWDTHDTAEYPEAFRTVKIRAELRKKHYEIEIDEDVIKALRKRSQKAGIPINQLVSDMLRKQISQAA